jgi:hypothetical protein
MKVPGLSCQKALHGPLPSEQTIENFLRAGGWLPLAGLPFAWISQSRGMAIFDARPANFVQIGETPVPFDVIPVPLSDL